MCPLINCFSIFYKLLFGVSYYNEIEKAFNLVGCPGDWGEGDRLHLLPRPAHRGGQETQQGITTVLEILRNKPSLT
jgi:hypothetical protein